MKHLHAILLFLAFVNIEGQDFASDEYAIILTNDYPNGGIGQITVENAPAGTVYSLSEASQLVQIDSHTGQLELLVDSAQVNNSEFEIRATFQSKTVKTEVHIFVLPLYYGDQFATDAINTVRRSLEKDKKTPEVAASIFVPAGLDLLLLQVAAGDPVDGISEAETIVERTIQLVHSIIIQQYEKDFGKGAVFAFLRTKELFSSEVITSLDKESTCIVATTPVTCLKKPIYRRFDGKCSNLKQPVAGGTGTALVRLLPAVYYDPDGLNDPFGFPNQPNPPPLPSPFQVTHDFIKDEVANSTSDQELTPLMMQLGQFMDHDFTLSAEETGASQCLAMTCDGSDNNYDAPCYPILPIEDSEQPCIKMIRSGAICQREGYPEERQQINDVTAVIDASNIYGSSKTASESLRDKRSLWIEIGGPRMKQIDTGMTSKVWAVDENGETFRLGPDQKWKNMNFALTHVSAGGSGVWGVDANNNVFRHVRGGDWKRISGIKLKQIDSGPEGIVLGVTKNNRVYCRSRNKWKMFYRRLKYISCGALLGNKGCWGVSLGNRVYYREGVTRENCAGTSWVPIDGRMKQIEVGGNGNVYAVDSDGKLYVREGVSSSNLYGSGWKFLREASSVTTGWTGQYLLDNGTVYRSSDDEGLLRTSEGDLLPLDTSCKASACVQACFVAGDMRANDQQGLTAFHTLFMREHNRIAKILRNLNGHWDGEKIYQETRKIIGAVIQKIAYDDYLPILLGPDALPIYSGHKEDVNPGIINSFTLAYRLGHSMIRSKFDLLNPNFDPIAPAVKLRFLFFNSTTINNYGVEPLLFGLAGNVSEKVDTHLTTEITEHLFERGNIHGENLAALNIQRSRDHGLPGYNAYRKLCKLQDATTFEDTKNEIQDPENRRILEELYDDNPNLVELWVAGIAETPSNGGVVGPTLRCIVGEQFRRARDGDRFYYLNKGVFLPRQVQEIKKTSLSRLYCNNLKDIVSIQRNAFKSSLDQPRPSCGEIPGMSLCAWKECLTGEPHFNSNTHKCVCRCSNNTKECPNKWTDAPGYSTLPFPIYSKRRGSRFVDLNGDGLLDFVYHLSTPKKSFKGAYINDPISKTFVLKPDFTPPVALATRKLSDLGVRFVDLNGDGKADLVYHRLKNDDEIVKGAYLNTGVGWKSSPEYIPPNLIAADDHGDLGVRFVELNGDGMIDFVFYRYISDKNQPKGAFINTGNGWKAAPEFTPPYPIAADDSDYDNYDYGYDYDYGDRSVRFVDLNGDGRMDMVYHQLISSGQVEKGAYINNGHTWVWSPEFIPPVRTDDQGARFVDINADGRVDLVYNTRITSKKSQKGAYMNNGYRWIWKPQYTPPFPIVDAKKGDYGARFIDVNGDGLPDMVWNRPGDKGAAINTGCGWKLDDSFSPPYTIASSKGKDLGVRFVDLNGDRAVDMIGRLMQKNKPTKKGAKLACAHAGNGNVGV